MLIIGCGIAGCTAALELAEKGIDVLLIGAGPSEWESSSALAQGGIVYRCEKENDAQLAADITYAGAGLCNPEAVEQLVSNGPHIVKELLIDKWGVSFDRNNDGSFAFTEEAAHSSPRILFSRDQTGKAIMQALFEKIRQSPHIRLKTGSSAVDLITLSHHSKQMTDIYKPSTCVGAYVMDNATETVNKVFAKETILATGGLGEVFLHTTNSKEARGDGVAMAYRAGARIMNMEYIQFHPTALYQSSERRFLLSEALRGEGAELLSSDFKPFMHRYHEKGSLAPRDIVARSIYQEMLQSETQHLWLDITSQSSNWIQQRFPHIYAHCLSKGLDMAHSPIPIVPAAHYACGGVAVDSKSKTSIQRLRAIGEVACTGLHGANRLASTSLLEGLVWAKICADDLIQKLPCRTDYFPPVDEWVMGDEVVDKALIQQDWMTIQQTMWNYVGLVRDKSRLCRALKMLHELKWEIRSFYEKGRLNPELLGLRNGIQTALLITQGALRNKQSLGCHYRLN